MTPSVWSNSVISGSKASSQMSTPADSWNAIGFTKKKKAEGKTSAKEKQFKRPGIGVE